MADPQRGDGFPEDDEGGSESTVSMASPTLDPSGMPSPVSVPPAAGGPPMPNLSVPTAPAPFAPQAPFAMSGQRPGTAQPSVPTPFGGLTPAAPTPKPLPAAGAPPQATGAAGAPPGMKRPQTVIGLAPPPVGSPRPGARMPLPSGGGKPMPSRAAAPATPPSSGRGVMKPPSSAKPVSPPPSDDTDNTDDQFAIPENQRPSIPDSQKEDFATMAKSPEESRALFGLDAGAAAAARAAVKPGAGAKPGTASKPGPGMPAMPPSNRSPLASTNLAPPSKAIGPSSSRPSGGGPPPLPPPSSQPQAQPPPKPQPQPHMGPSGMPVLHDRNEEEESTRAVSREEMLRGHDAVIIGEDSEGAQGEDATLAISPGMNDAANPKIAALAATLSNDAVSQQGAFPPSVPGNPMGAPPPPPGFDPNFGQPPPPAPPHGPHAMPANPNWQQPPPMAPPQGWQDPNAFQGPPNTQSYPGMAVGPVSGPHMPAQSWTPNPPPSQPQFPVAPQSQPQLQASQPIPYPGQPNIHQPPGNQFGDWNAVQQAPLKKKGSKMSGQIILLGIVGVVCLAIFVTGIVLFATTKF